MPRCDRDTLDQAITQIQQAFDWGEGGWGGAPKFPQPMALEFLMRVYARTRDELVLKMITKTLDKMARGGMYDQLGGGFHRYSTDANWIVPHFEKMLYDNAQLARVYTHAWQMTQNEFYRRIAEQTLDYVAREMQHPAGGFVLNAGRGFGRTRRQILRVDAGRNPRCCRRGRATGHRRVRGHGPRQF